MRDYFSSCYRVVGGDINAINETTDYGVILFLKFGKIILFLAETQNVIILLSNRG